MVIRKSGDPPLHIRATFLPSGGLWKKSSVSVV